MALRKILVLAVMMTSFACSCTTSRTSPDLIASVASLRQYADSFKGLSIEEARSRLTGAALTEDEWMERGFGGKQLVAKFPKYEVRVLFLGDRVITTSVQILSK